MKKNHLFFAIFVFINFANLVFSQEEKSYKLQFKQNKGDSVSHVSTVEEEAYLNGYLNNRTQFINRTTTTIKDVLKNSDAQLFTHYMTTQNTLSSATGTHLSWGEEDSVSIKRKSNGELYDSENENLPTVRGIPTFPDYEVKIGDSWTAKGLEVHDFKELFNMTEPIEIPFEATYTLSGTEIIDSNEVFVIDVYYELYQDAYTENLYKGSYYSGTEGTSLQKIYWDNKRGDLAAYSEEFIIKMYDIFGNSFIYHGIADGKVTEYKSLNDDDYVKQIQDTVDNLNIDNVSVKKGEKGLTISLENIQFEPDSNVLLPSEKVKLQKIGEILKNFSNDILITGHCAERGTEKARQKLSEERAESVASYIEQLGIRDEYHIYTEGKGSKEPIATNATEAGRAKNRRVEITLMD